MGKRWGEPKDNDDLYDPIKRATLLIKIGLALAVAGFALVIAGYLV